MFEEGTGIAPELDAGTDAGTVRPSKDFLHGLITVKTFKGLCGDTRISVKALVEAMPQCVRELLDKCDGEGTLVNGHPDPVVRDNLGFVVSLTREYRKAALVALTVDLLA